MKNKRKFNFKRAAFVALVLILVIAGCVSLVDFGINAYVQNQRHTELERVLNIRQAFLNQTDKLQNTGNISNSTFESLRSLAKEDNASSYTFLNSYLDGEEIDQETYEKILALSPETDGHQFLNLLENTYQIPEEFINFVISDPDRLSFVQEYTNRSNHLNTPDKLSESLKTVPLLLQWDLRWGYQPYGDSIIAYAGCAPTSLAMIYSYLNQDPSITPLKLARYSEEHDYYVNGVGTSHAMVNNSPADYGINVESVNLDANAVKAALADGKILLASVVPGDFTRTGHFIVITGLEGDKLVINDPNSIKNSKTRWDISRVLGQTGALWAFSK